MDKIIGKSGIKSSKNKNFSKKKAKKAKKSVDWYWLYSLYYSIIKKEFLDMNELNCKNCETPTECEEGVVNVTCGYCCATMGVCMEEN